MEALSLDQACFVILKARQWKADEVNSGAKVALDERISILEDEEEDATFSELTSFIDVFNDEAQCELVALAWLGRDKHVADDWSDVLAQARKRHNRYTAAYLLGMPQIADYLERGLDQLGLSCTELERVYV